ncbi:hypothetical protein FAI40_05875 [Acetobacteraceae bacterium]|nr:hypothetical protein FAI40_05875 [Acetobacteraceae bacterium]
MTPNKQAMRHIPRLRFFEFRDAPAWEGKKLGKVASLVADKISSKQLPKGRYLSTDSILPNFSGVLFGHSSLPEGNVTYFLEGDILLSNIRIYLEKAWLADGLGGCSNDCLVFRAGSCINPYFLYHIQTSKAFIDYAVKTSKGVKMPRGDKGSLLDYLLYLPSISEQKKIADCLSSLDDLIVATSDKVEKLKEYKKGLMQKLFPKEGETTPRLRFPDFRDAPAWEGKKLGEIAHIVMGSSPASTFYNDEKDGLPLLQGNADIRNRVSCPRIFTSSITQECKDGDILLSVRAPVGMIARSHHHACIGRGLSVLRTYRINNQDFLYQYLIQLESKWSRLSQGSTFEAVNSADIKSLCLFIPGFLEQKKIAACLSSLDNLIAATAEKAEQLKKYKKALMQKLFPA